MTSIRLSAWTLAGAVVLTAGLTGCSTSTNAAAIEQVAEAPAGQLTPGRVDVAQFGEVITRPGVQIIDVRTPEEFAAGHIRGAVNIPVQQSGFAARIAQLDPSGSYAVYCRSGNRSQGEVAQMKSAGIVNIYELAEGTNGWTADGQPLIR